MVTERRSGPGANTCLLAISRSRPKARHSKYQVLIAKGSYFFDRGVGTTFNGSTQATPVPLSPDRKIETSAKSGSAQGESSDFWGLRSLSADQPTWSRSAVTWVERLEKRRADTVAVGNLDEEIWAKHPSTARAPTGACLATRFYHHAH